ncbi:peptidoglycan/LPS O-acetylase OafA/YrhL [Mycetocola sp. BIGb0189]|uniref:acyltransferase family protein n=1 Tax=Mycetocola sp. BIGb0189 TaxID=2940604 RepID=UPI0021694827|nr:acyltransferase [Mycetocola sp. BIGb0189]MCS4277037.1 peptidoglycan/LPS O-acetylase OafA/YrhL [Mycetocola sp. BIGb0189]
MGRTVSLAQGSTSRARPTVSAALQGHRNSLGIIRLVLAGSVIFSHAFPLGGWGQDPTLLWTKEENLGGLAVLGFFAISGYLITKSGMNADAVQFFWRRSLRIFPAYWLVLIVAALAVGPLVWHLMDRPLSAYFVSQPGWFGSYLRGNAMLTIQHFGILDIFQSTTPYGNQTGGSVLNGSIWTLEREWACYLIIGVLVLIGAMRFARWMVPVLTGVFFTFALIRHINPEFLAAYAPFLTDRFAIQLPLVFLWGAILAVYSTRIPMSNVAGIASGVVFLIAIQFQLLDTLGYPALAYFLFWVAAALPQSWQWIGAKNDYSYGLYLYGFLVQQFTAYLGWHNWGYLPWTLASLVISFALAWLSWHVVEKWAMRLKDWGPGRGIRFWWNRLVSPLLSGGTKRPAPRHAAARPAKHRG